jgi:hypothetical protein
VVKAVVEDGEGGCAVVFGDDLDTVGGLGDFKACFGDKEGDIGELADSSVVAVKEGTSTDDVTVLDGFGGESI